jgi:anti-sigma factor (TIGR02949 family)
MTPEHRHDELTVDCETVMRQLWDYLDGELTAERMAAIRAHLAVCARCYPQYEFERAFLAALDRAQRQPSDPRALSARVMSALQAEGLAEV